MADEEEDDEEEDDDAASMDSAADADAALLDEFDDEAELAQLEALLAAAQQPHASAYELLGYHEPPADGDEFVRRYLELEACFVLAVKHGRVDVAELLRDDSLDVELVTDVNDGPVVHIAALRGHGAMVEFLVANGVSVRQVDQWNRTPATVAYAHGHDALGDMLRAHDAAVAAAAAAAEAAAAAAAVAAAQ